MLQPFSLVLVFTACVLNRVQFVVAMRFDDREGWVFPWPGPQRDKRLYFRDTAVVYAWPSAGGRLELQNPGPFELAFLGIEDRLNEMNSSLDPAIEDTFAQRLRYLGGTFYEHQYGERYREFEQETLITWLGWPEDEEHSGGVWVLQTTQSRLESSHPNDNKTGRIRLAATMQERCRAIEMCGGTFYASPTEEHLVPMRPAPKLDSQAQDRCRARRDALELGLERDRNRDLV